MLVVLLEAAGHEPALDQRTLAAVAALGVTGVSLVRDHRTMGLVLEGWAFDPAQSAGAAVAAVAGDGRAQTLHQVMHMAVSTASMEGDPR
jgi:hypothetical protein